MQVAPRAGDDVPGVRPIPAHVTRERERTHRDSPFAAVGVVDRPTDRAAAGAWHPLAVVAVLIVVGTALRVFRLGHQSLWNDEIVTFISAQGTPWHVLTQREENSNILPLYYLVANGALSLRGVLGVESALRLPSVIAGVLSIPLLFAVARRWLGDRLAALAAALMTVAPFHVWYSQEARPYALLLLLSLVALYCLEHALDRPGRWGWKAASAIAIAAVFYCHTIGIAFAGFAAACVFVTTSAEVAPGPGWWARLRARAPALWGSQWRDWTVVFVAVALLCLPGVARLASFPPTTSADSTRAGTPAQLGYALWSFAVGFSFGPSLEELHATHRWAVLRHYAPGVIPVALGIIGLTGLGVRSLARRWPAAGVIGLWLLLPLGFAEVGSLLTVHPFNVRYAVISFLPALVVWVVGLAAVRPRSLRIVVGAGALAVCGVALAQYFGDPKYARDDNRGAAAFLTAHARPGDLIIAHRAFTGRDLAFYAPAVAMRVLPFPSEVQREAGLGVLQQLDFATHDVTRVWLFLSRGTAEEEAPLVSFCDQRFRRDDTYVSSGVRLLGYERDPPADGGRAPVAAAP